MTTRKEIENRLGVFASRVLFDNCGIGADGFEPGNKCGGKSGSSGDSKSKTATGKKHTVKLPANPKRLNIDAADAALKQMGYSISDPKSSPGEGGRWETGYLLRSPDGSTKRVSVAEIAKLVYAGKS